MSSRSSRRLLLLMGLLLLAVMHLDEVACQFMAGPAFFGNPQATGSQATRSQVIPTTSASSASGSLQAKPSSSSDNDERSNSGSDSDGSSSNDDNSESSSGDGSGDDSGSWFQGSGSSSSSLEYGCDCRSVRRVSLMGASDYCLDPNAPLSSKCGNVDLGESGACPVTGAHPCSPKGHVLANDSMCLMDDKDETYKCVATKEDLEIQKHGKKKKKHKSSRQHGSDSSMSSAPSHLASTARQVLAIMLCVAAGVIAVM